MIGLRFAVDRPLRILALGAHPDDIEIGAGGLLISMLRQGLVESLEYVVLSGSGDRGREAEVSVATLVAGRAEVKATIGDLRERFLHVDSTTKEFVDDLGSRSRPDLILAPRLEDRHQDHRALAEAVWQAFREHAILEYEIPKYEGDLGTPNAYLPLSAGDVDAKVAHLMTAFPSQRHRPWYDDGAFRAILRLRGIESNAQSGYAEGFTMRKATLDPGGSTGGS